ncbi:MAG: hypothetical protein JST26_20845 [Bacteroidetes bacterium]|nr:hypothetical protein [Bacteroidota bacterium]
MRKVVLFLCIVLTACIEQKTEEQKVRNFLRYSIEGSDLRSYELRRNENYILPFRKFIKIKTDRKEFEKISTFFNLRSINSLQHDSIYVDLNRIKAFHYIPITAYADSALYFQMHHELKNNTLNWWDIKDTDTSSMLIGFVNVANENYITPLTKPCIGNEKCVAGKFICQYQNGYIYICICIGNIL